MYIVVSRWKPLNGTTDKFEKAGQRVMATMRAVPGVLFFQTLKTGDQYVTVHAYEDEATYAQLIHDEKSVFAKALKATKLEEYGHWLSSEKGVSI